LLSLPTTELAENGEDRHICHFCPQKRGKSLEPLRSRELSSSTEYWSWFCTE